MENSKTFDLIIIGAGLTGVATAYYLRKSGLSIAILEASEKVGGRIQTVGFEGDTPIEMGATWLGEQHVSLRHLLKELDIETFEQEIGKHAVYEAISTSPHYLAQLPPNPEPSLRIKGGTFSIIQKLKSQLVNTKIVLNQKLLNISKETDAIYISTSEGKFSSQKVISTLPPNLLINTIDINPELPSSLINIAKQTHTWMGESIKIAISYKEAFWKKSSGTIISNVGPITEMYDHSNYEESSFALMGFLNDTYYGLTREERLQLVLNQLKKYYGEQALDYISYHEKVWKNEPLTFTDYQDYIIPHKNNGHQVFQEAYLNNSFRMAGTETSDKFPGYMEGAINSAKVVSSWVAEE